MEGHWHGHGVRNYPISGRQVQVDAEVQTSYEVIRGQTALVSQNQITESASNTPPRTYQSTYWVRPSEGVPQSDHYELGAQGSDQAGSTGVLTSDGGFEVEQDLGNGYVVRSRTEFQQDRTIYSDTFTVGNEIQSQTHIEYRRTTPLGGP